MYFGIVGDNSTIISEGLLYLHPTNFEQPRKNIITFDTLYPERLKTCAVLIKRGIIMGNKELSDTEDSSRIDFDVSKLSTIGVETKELGSHLKKQITSIKRFKLVDLIHTDLEIKKDGTEIINIDNSNYGIVLGYQNITLYETVDFGKPVGGMNIGMMPSKLALTLINIGIGEHENTLKFKIQNLKPTIWDPFCGFGTTNFLTNALGYNTIASDINVTSIKQNQKRRSTTPLYHTENITTIIKQDVTKDFKSPLFLHSNIVVSEGWLGHVVTSRTAPATMHLYAKEVLDVYLLFAKNLTDMFKRKNSNSYSNKENLEGGTLVITIPVWLKYEISVSDQILEEFKKLGRTARLITQPYSREKQLIGRQVLIASIE